MLQYPNRSLTSCFHIDLTCSVISASYDLSARFKLPLGVPFLLSTQHSFPYYNNAYIHYSTLPILTNSKRYGPTQR
jgi:hypothetical protein